MTRIVLFAILLMLHHGGGPPSNVSIPVTSLSTGNFSANNWTGIASPATTVSNASGLHLIQSQTNIAGQMLATGNGIWRDEEITSYTSRGVFVIRLSGGNALFFSTNVTATNQVNIGIVTGFDPTNPETSGTRFSTFVESNASGCITNWPSTGAHTFTFGAQGFNVYLKIDGVQAIDTCQTTTINPTGAIAYQEYRPQAMNSGQAGIWAHAASGGARDININYSPTTPLLSAYASNSFDPRDFGMRSIGAVTGSMSASSAVLNLNSSADIRVGDQVIVQIGGEAGGGLQNSVGVGGVSPMLNYTNATTRDADHTQADGTLAWIQTDGSTWQYAVSSTSWVTPTLPSYYNLVRVPISLAAKVLAVNGSPATQVTLNAPAFVATTNASVYLDSMPTFYPFTTLPAYNFVAGRSDGLDNYANMSMNIPAGTWQFSNNIVGIGSNRSGFTLTGAGKASTTLQSPQGVPSQVLDLAASNSNMTVSGFTYVGNLADNGYMWAYTGTNKQFPGDNPIAMTGGTLASNVTFHDVACLNDMRGCITLAGTNPQILNSTATVNVGQRTYFQWQFQLINCTGGQISNSTAVGTFLLKSFEVFACNGASINNVTGTNALFSTNSSTSWTISDFTDTIQANSFFNVNSGSPDEAILNVNDNAFGTGNTGLVGGNWSIVQQGYIDASFNTLKFIQISAPQTNVTVQGGFPGSGGCSTTLPGFMSAPNYNATSAEYGAMAVYSDAPNTIVENIRIKGTAIGSPGLSGHFGNISLLGATSQANNNVADVIQTGPTQSGNQTNAAYGGC